MKKMIFLCAAAMILASACTNSNDDNTPSNDVNNIVADGEWIVGYFWDKTKDETHKFSGYTFSFLDNGVLRATKQGATATGTWSVNSSQTRLTLSIGTADPLEELNDDWIIAERSADLIRLRDDNDTHLEELHFRKR